MVNIQSGERSGRGFRHDQACGTSYWIDDGDVSKRNFTLLMIFTSLSEAGVVPQIPMLTLPVR